VGEVPARHPARVVAEFGFTSTSAQFGAASSGSLVVLVVVLVDASPLLLLVATGPEVPVSEVSPVPDVGMLVSPELVSSSEVALVCPPELADADVPGSPPQPASASAHK
jgi:hypothetical protein